MEMMELLLRAGAEPDVLDSQGESPGEKALQAGVRLPIPGTTEEIQESRLSLFRDWDTSRHSQFPQVFRRKVSVLIICGVLCVEDAGVSMAARFLGELIQSLATVMEESGVSFEEDRLVAEGRKDSSPPRAALPPAGPEPSPPASGKGFPGSGRGVSGGGRSGTSSHPRPESRPLEEPGRADTVRIPSGGQEEKKSRKQVRQGRRLVLNAGPAEVDDCGEDNPEEEIHSMQGNHEEGAAALLRTAGSSGHFRRGVTEGDGNRERHLLGKSHREGHREEDKQLKGGKEGKTAISPQGVRMVTGEVGARKVRHRGDEGRLVAKKKQGARRPLAPETGPSLVFSSGDGDDDEENPFACPDDFSDVAAKMGGRLRGTRAREALAGKSGSNFDATPVISKPDPLSFVRNMHAGTRSMINRPVR